MSTIINKIATEIEQQFKQGGHPSTWDNKLIKVFLYDMEDKLSDVFKQDRKKAIACGVLDSKQDWLPMNVTTFQRIFKTFETKKPNSTTLNALCIYLGYENTEDFQLKNDAIEAPQIYKPAHTNLPKQPSYFKGREENIREIHQKLIDDKFSENVILASGVGGIGKTTLIHEYINRSICQNYFKQIIYISVNKNLENAFIQTIAFALKIDLTIYPKQAEQLLVITQELRKIKGNNLIVIDNINEHDKDDLIGMKPIFEQINWSFLITTRTAPDDFFTITISELPIEEAAQIFAYHYLPAKIPTTAAINDLVENDQPTIEILIEHIHRHTLLIELLGKVGLKRGLKISMLLEFLKGQDKKYKGIGFQKDQLQKVIPTGEHAKSAQLESKATIHQYVLSLFEPELLQENEKTMVRFFSVLPSEDFLIEDLKMLWQVEEHKAIEFEDRLDDLQQSGWFSVKHHEHSEEYIQNLSYKMHPLVQEVVYEKLTPNIDNVRPLVQTITQILSTSLKHPQKIQNYAKSVIDKLNFLYSR